MEISLYVLPEGGEARVNSLHIGVALRRRLSDFGLVEGTKILCLRSAALSGMGLYRVRGTMLALRKADCAMIRVELCD